MSVRRRTPPPQRIYARPSTLFQRSAQSVPPYGRWAAEEWSLASKMAHAAPQAGAHQRQNRGKLICPNSAICRGTRCRTGWCRRSHLSAQPTEGARV